MTAAVSAVWGGRRREGEGGRGREGEGGRGRDSLMSVIHVIHIISCQYRPSELVSILYSQLVATHFALVEIGSVPSEQ